MSATLNIDPGRCRGHGRCYWVAPNLLSDDPEGFVAERGTPVPVPDALIGEAEEAVDSCPEQAVSLVRD